MNSSDTHEDEGGKPLSAEALSAVLYRQVTSDDAFDAIEEATRMTPTEFVVHPFDGPALLVKVVPGPE